MRGITLKMTLKNVYAYLTQDCNCSQRNKKAYYPVLSTAQTHTYTSFYNNFFLFEISTTVKAAFTNDQILLQKKHIKTG